LGAACLLGALLFVATGVYLTGSGGTAAATARRPVKAAKAPARVVIGTSVKFAPASTSGPMNCQPVGRSSGYVDPLARARVRGERVDMGVDYAGQGRLVTIGASKVTWVGTAGTGWPGAFVEYRLLSGPDAGCFVYYAEGVAPVARLHVGELLPAGHPIATIIPGWSTGIELGWGAGRSTTTLAELHGHWTQTDDAGDVASGAGRSFSALVRDLGGPAGRIEH
jgi:hypothetical protein